MRGCYACGVRDARALELNLRWLVKLRWAAILGLALAVAVAERALHVALPGEAMLGMVGIGVLTNAGAHWMSWRGRVTSRLLQGLLITDVALLTGALYVAGGIYNPFILSYLALVLLAAALLGRREAARLSVMVVACVVLLAVRHRPLQADHQHHDRHAHAGDEHHHGHDVSATSHVRVHAEDMWLAFVILAALIAYLGNWSLRQRELELDALRADKRESDRLAELGALAATAAHELSSPLTTIAIASKELVHAIERGDDLRDRVADVRLIREEVERCREALDAMAQRARDERQGPVRVRELVEQARARTDDPARVSLDVDENDAWVDAPRAAIVEVLRGLLANAVEASPAAEHVTLRVRGEGERCRIDVIDAGEGMDDAHLERAGKEPFSTKGTMGVGLFAGRAVIEKLGGELELASRPGAGTRVTLRLPVVAGDVA